MTDRSSDLEYPVPEFSVVVPFFNEAESAIVLVEEIAEAMKGTRFELVAVDDCSIDGTAARLQSMVARVPTLRLIQHGRNCGQSAALCSGIDAARGRWIITLDGDGQNDPADIPALLEARESNGEKIDLICGHRQKRNDTWLRRFSSRVANGVRSRLLGDATPDTGCGLKVFERHTFMGLPRFDHMHRFLPALVQRQHGRVRSIRVSHRARRYGESKYGVWNRLWVGIVDLFGVMWLKRRAFVRDQE